MQVGTFVKLGLRREDGEGQVAFYEVLDASWVLGSAAHG